MRALLAAVLFAAAFARAADEPFTRLQSAPEPADRIAACAALSQPPHRGPRAYAALRSAMSGDLSERVRLAAAVAALTYAGGRTLADADAFLKSEPGSRVRRELLVALSTEPAHFSSPDATRIIAVALAEDPSVEVRLGAAKALGARGDAWAVGAVKRAAEEDANPAVRDAARGALIVLSKPPKPKPKPKIKPPKADAVLGRDPCPFPWGWCGCEGVVTLAPKCRTRDECRGIQSEMRIHGLVCKWDGRSDD